MSLSFATSTAPPRITDDTARGQFVARVYGHVAIAFGLFLALETALFVSGIAEAMGKAIAGKPMMWLLLMGGVMIVSSISSSLATKADPQTQLKGLALIALAKAVMFAPFLYYIRLQDDGNSVIATAGFVTLLGIVGLTAVAYTTRKDLSFLKPITSFLLVLALVAIVGSLIFGFNLGLWFSVAMVGVAGVRILHQTQEILRKYPENAYAAAALVLFSSYMLMFWYVLRIFASRN